MATVLDQLSDAVDALVSTDPTTLGDGETLVELHRQLSRLDAVVARSAASFDASGEWKMSRARSAAAWLAHARRIPIMAARRFVRLGRALRELPVAEAAWTAGSIDGAHVEKMIQVANRSPVARSAMVRDEAMLVAVAVIERFTAFDRHLDYWFQAVDADGADDLDRKRHETRSLHCSKSFEDMVLGDFTLPPIEGAIVDGELRRLNDRLFDAEWAEVKERLGRDPHVDELDRTPSQRRADALVEMAARSRANQATSRMPAPLFTVLVGWETLHGRICELADGTVVSPASLLPWLDKALLERVVFNGKSRVIDVGPERRLYTGATKRAVQVENLECFEEVCAERYEQCQLDHDQPHSEGGPTTIENGHLACGFHNRLRNRQPDDWTRDTV